MFLFFETGFLCVTALAVLKLALVDQAGLELTDSLASARIRGVRRHRLAESFMCSERGVSTS